jgi:aminoglycoside phosphotransferase (APT) family kinase protein
VLADRADGVVVRHGEIVLKAHAQETDSDDLGVRISVAAHPTLTGILLPPRPLLAHEGRFTAVLHGRPVSAWPYGSPVDPERPEDAPWEEAATLLARLHRVPVDGLPGPLPPMHGPAKAARAIARMTASRPAPEIAAPVLRAWRTLPPWARDEIPARHAPTLCHGDLHLGQLVRHPAPHGPWLLIDVDDLGTGDPAWDLARPAAWFAAGLLAPDIWQCFVDTYRAAGGPAVPAEGDPWPQLDVPARALTVQTAALAVARATAQHRDLDEVEQAMADSCYRIAAHRPEPAFDFSK